MYASGIKRFLERNVQSGRLIERRSNFGDDSRLIGRIIEPIRYVIRYLCS